VIELYLFTLLECCCRNVAHFLGGFTLLKLIVKNFFLIITLKTFSIFLTDIEKASKTLITDDVKTSGGEWGGERLKPIVPTKFFFFLGGGYTAELSSKSTWTVNNML